MLKLLLFCGFFNFAVASVGDQSKYYRDCVQDCEKNCQESNAYRGFPFWSCDDDCEYGCQWETVDRFIERKWSIPQFGGKWPFIRYFGLQEPASAIFSILNFLVVLYGLRKFRAAVPADAPYFKLWHFYSLVCLNCWIWSTVYHTRDSMTTERLDYLSASCMVFTSFFTMTVRVFELKFSIMSVIWSIACGSVILNHCAYLWLFRFDYSYNMIFNVIVGALTVFGWLIWSAINRRSHLKYVAAYSILMGASALLELADFPPIFWLFDAHALWHLATCFIIPIFYQFIIKDCLYARQSKIE